jgi:hypothetical protein
MVEQAVCVHTPLMGHQGFLVYAADGRATLAIIRAFVLPLAFERELVAARGYHLALERAAEAEERDD